MATNSEMAVILRRGPSQWSQLLQWDRSRDSVTPGQWFHGRVYERRCDLSPNGRYFIYFAAKHGRRPSNADDLGEAWTAISRPPYFTAIATWPNIGSWYGGGVFRANDHVELDATCTLETRSFSPSRKLKTTAMDPATSPWEQRLLRADWQLVERGFHPRTHRRVGTREIWKKTDPGSRATLCREMADVDFKRVGAPYLETFWLEIDGDIVPIEGTTWADWDRRRLVFVRDGKVYAARLAGTKLKETELIDLNPMRPQELAPPAWATGW